MRVTFIIIVCALLTCGCSHKLKVDEHCSIILPIDCWNLAIKRIGKDVIQVEVLLDGGVFILHDRDVFTYTKANPLWGRYKDARRKKSIAVSHSLKVALDGVDAAPDEYVQREEF
jgi:hypothetical protein